MHAVLAARHEVIARWVVDRWIVLEELIQAQRWVILDDGPADVSSLDFVELVTFCVVVCRADGRGDTLADTVGASRVQVVTSRTVDGRVQIEELGRGKPIGSRNGLAVAGGNEVALRAVRDQCWARPVPLNEESGLRVVSTCTNDDVGYCSRPGR